MMVRKVIKKCINQRLKRWAEDDVSRISYSGLEFPTIPGWGLKLETVSSGDNVRVDLNPFL